MIDHHAAEVVDRLEEAAGQGRAYLLGHATTDIGQAPISKRRLTTLRHACAYRFALPSVRFVAPPSLFHPPPPAADRRRRTNSPRTSASILVRRKQSSASSGLQTTGSFSLNEVLSTIGTPVMSLKAAISAW